VVLQLVAYNVTNLEESTTDCKRTEKKLIASIGFKDQIEVSPQGFSCCLSLRIPQDRYIWVWSPYSCGPSEIYFLIS
jgi:hypothetical protein